MLCNRQDFGEWNCGLFGIFGIQFGTADLDESAVILPCHLLDLGWIPARLGSEGACNPLVTELIDVISLGAVDDDPALFRFLQQGKQFDDVDVEDPGDEGDLERASNDGTAVKDVEQLAIKSLQLVCNHVLEFAARVN